MRSSDAAGVPDGTDVPVVDVERYGLYRDKLKFMLQQLLLLYPVRLLVCFLRYLLFVHIHRRLRTFDTDSGEVSENTVFHNLQGLRQFGASSPLKLIRPLSCIESLGTRSRVLCVGPRNEAEILLLAGHGFALSNLRGLDLISYSPWIDLGDMHRMPYSDSAWDAVLLGWCLAYSNAPGRVAGEVVRVVRAGGIVAAGVEHRTDSPEEVFDQLGYRAGSLRRIRTVAELLGLFGDYVDHVYFSHDVLPQARHRPGQILAIFSVKK